MKQGSATVFKRYSWKAHSVHHKHVHCSNKLISVMSWFDQLGLHAGIYWAHELSSSEWPDLVSSWALNEPDLVSTGKGGIRSATTKQPTSRDSTFITLQSVKGSSGPRLCSLHLQWKGLSPALADWYFGRGKGEESLQTDCVSEHWGLEQRTEAKCDWLRWDRVHTSGWKLIACQANQSGIRPEEPGVNTMQWRFLNQSRIIRAHELSSVVRITDQ